MGKYVFDARQTGIHTLGVCKYLLLFSVILAGACATSNV